MALAAVVLCFAPAAVAGPSGVTYQGRILKPDGTPLSGVTTQFRMQIRTPDSHNCLFYEEEQTEDLSSTNGAFSLTINDGSGTRTDSTGLSLDRIFANYGSFSLNSATCTSGSGVYAPSSSDGRTLAVFFKDETMATWEPIPVQKINFVPFAFEAKQVQGFTADSLLRVVNVSGDPITGISPFSNAQYTELLALLAGTSAQFEKPGTLGGASLPTLGVGQAGQFLSWNGTGWATASASVGADSVSSANIVNGTITGSDLATNIAISTTSSITTSGTVASNISTAHDFRIYDSDASPNENYISIRAPVTLPSNYNYVWPSSYGLSTQVLTTDGSGNLSWSAGGSSSQWSNGSAGAIGYTGGSVGIGTTSPSARLTVAGSAVIGANNTATGDFALAVGEYSHAGGQSSFAAGGAANATSLESVALGSNSATYGSSAIALGNGPRATGDGSVAIGYARTGSGYAGSGGNYSVAIAAGNSAGVSPYVSGDSSFGIFLGDQSGVSVTANNVMAIMGGNVGIGTTGPGYRLDVAGDANIASTGVLRFGGVSVCTSTGCTSSSDRRLKEKIQPLQGALEKVLSLQGVEYDYKDKSKFSSQRQIGLIAQDVEHVYPEVVKTDSESGFKSVAYDHMIAPLIEAFKTLYQRLINLEDRQSTLERGVASVQNENAELKRKLEELENLRDAQARQLDAMKSWICASDPAAKLCD